MENFTNKSREHIVNMKDRKSLSLTGVKDVGNFSEELVTILLESGELIVRGSSLHISKLSVETGELSIDGIISSLTYTENMTGGGFFKKLFK